MLCLATNLSAQQVGKPLSVWQKGYLDIHQINTGQGNATFAILPDGTTLLIDAGAINTVNWRTGKPRNLPVKPTNQRQAGEWIARYIRKTLRFQANPAIDYALITHFHDDHMGSPLNVTKRSAGGGYVLAGITEVGEYVPIRRLLDRGWPDYTYPRSLDTDSMVMNYRQFLDWQRGHTGLVVEQFQAGRNDQIKLLNQPGAYTNQFEIRNLIVNGNLWTGEGQQTERLFPELATLPPAQYPNENMCSIAVRIRYGPFDYFSGGDLPGVLQFGEPAWHDVETPLAKVMGPVDVHLLDHHGYADSENGALLASLRPRVLVIPAWASSHPGRDVLERIYSEQSYAGERDVFATNLLDETKIALGDLAPRLKSMAGHVVVRVEPGGKTYHVLVLDDGDEQLRIKAIHGPYQAQ
jgi:beta-lactamase superfamily II metal-dependent hydrolase